jgi:PPOX class probable F420-dependent enzyme
VNGSSRNPLATALAGEGAAWAREHLDRDVVGWLTTIAPDGRVQSSPISFVYVDGEILIYSDPKAPKARNIRANPQVSFHLESDRYGDHWLIVEGRAVIDESLPPLDEHPAYVAKFAAEYGHWGLTLEGTAPDISLPIRIEPTRVRVG